MSCPTCDHTLYGLGDGYFHCPRCGTAKTPRGKYYRPMLVDRCRNMEPALGHDARPAWRGLGIAESINRPADRA